MQDSNTLGDNDLDDRPPLTREQAQALRQQLPQVSPWRVLGWQVLVGAGVVALAYAFTLSSDVALSALYGAAAVVVPGAVFARGLTSRVGRLNAGAAVFTFFLWEFVKIALTVAGLLAAPKVVDPLSWPAMLVAMVITMKVYWVALAVRPQQGPQDNPGQTTVAKQ
jgi:ATP synthase protein I